MSEPRLRLEGWRGATIVVTGGAGYLGSRLIRDLAGDERFAGATIRVVDNLSRESHVALFDLPAGVRFELIEGDILDPAASRMALRGADAVVHLAALVSTPFSFTDPVWTEHVNHWGAARFAEEALAADARRFVHASSASVYGPGGPYTEDDACNPVGPYSQSKARSEDALRALGARGLNVTVLRFGAVYGLAPAVRFHAAPNRFVYRAATGRSVAIHGDGSQRRSIVHVADASAAIRLALIDGGTVGRTLNVAAETRPVGEVAAVAAGLVGAPMRYTDQHALSQFSLDIDAQALAALGWSPRVSLEEGLRELCSRIGPFASTAIAA